MAAPTSDLSIVLYGNPPLDTPTPPKSDAGTQGNDGSEPYIVKG